MLTTYTATILYGNVSWAGANVNASANVALNILANGVVVGTSTLSGLDQGSPWTPVTASWTPTSDYAGQAIQLQVVANNFLEGPASTQEWQVPTFALTQATLTATSESGLPTAPGGLTATPISSTETDLNWTDNSNNETGFKIDQATSSDFSTGLTTATVGATVTTYNPIGLSPMTTYYYRVRATNTVGDSANTSTASATTTAPGVLPVPDGDFTDTAGYYINSNNVGGVNFPTPITAALSGWSITADPSTVNDGYYAAWRPYGVVDNITSGSGASPYNMNAPWIGNQPASSYQAFVYYPGEQYNYGGVVGGAQPGASLTMTTAPIGQTVLTGTTYTATIDCANVSWGGVDVNPSATVALNILADGAVVGTGTLSGLTQGSPWTPVTATWTASTYGGSHIQLQVVANNFLEGPGATQQWQVPTFAFTHATLMATSESDVPTITSATISSPDQVDLSWFDYSAIASGYIVSASTDGGTTWTQLPSEVPAASGDGYGDYTYSATGLTPDQTYTFKVTADNNGVEFADSDLITATAIGSTLSATGPSTINEGDAYMLTLSSTTPTDGISSPIDHWQINWNDGTGSSTDDIQTVTGATPGTVSHTFPSGTPSGDVTITAVDGLGNTFAQPDQPFDVVPSAPTGLVPTVASPTEIGLTWTDNSQIEMGFTILRSDDGGATFAQVGYTDANVTSYADPGLQPSSTYSYEICSTSGANEEADSSPTWSEPVTTLPQEPPGQPTLSAAASATDPNAAVLTWTYQGTDDLGFELEMEDASTGENYHLFATPNPVDSTGTASTTVSGLTSGDTYYFRIRADHFGGTASKYTEATFSPALVPAPELFVEHVDAFIRVGWAGAPTDGSIQLQVRGDAFAGQSWHTVTFGNGSSSPAWPATATGDEGGYGYNHPPYSDPRLEGFLLGPEIQGPGNYQYRIRSGDSNGNLSGWSLPQSITFTDPGPDSPAATGLQFTATDTTITATWNVPIYEYDSPLETLFIQPQGQPGYSVNAWSMPKAWLSGLPSGPYSNGSDPFTATLTGLTPGTDYSICLWSAQRPNGDDDFEYPAFTTATVATTGGSLAPPAAPAGLHAVDLGVGSIGLHIVELIWENIPNNEDGFVIQTSNNPDFLPAGATFRVGADVTNFIDNYAIDSNYYRVAAYRGTALSAFVNTSITPFNPPTAMAISWIPNNGAYVPFDLTSNSQPPLQFDSPGTSNSLTNFISSEDYRDILSLSVWITVDPYSGLINGVNPKVDQTVGYTPVPYTWGLAHIPGEGDAKIVKQQFNPNHTQVTVTVLARFRVNWVENAIFLGLLSRNQSGTFHRLAWAWAKIAYTIDVSGRASAAFHGSLVPSQTDYINELTVGQYNMPAGVAPFLDADYDKLGPFGF